MGSGDVRAVPMPAAMRSGAAAAWAGPAAGAAAQPVLLAMLTGAVGLGTVGWAAGAAYALAVWGLLTRALYRDGPRAMGPADRVTLARAVLVGGVTALVAEEIAGRPLDGAALALVVALAAVALVLDGVDGLVARRTDTASTLGARFDMEVDAFLILVLSLHVAVHLGPWVLAIGAMRYAFAAAATAAPWLHGDLPPSTPRKAVAVAQAAALIAAASATLPDAGAAVLVAGALALLIWSFGRDIGWLWRTRAARPGTGPDADGGR
ncbi:phosphatidylglycerophosphate synthase [Nocardiopsis mwathae]|uniref:Phosphatidylglycerophosphate synthase n=2 Tax=Nocardiopsis mwathae TaxID=1472723 RepID=A0A7X0D736_9ACTN|nr:CDP-alcohol phosphatidyltransferase family protein [Nocardiopsis mwathae]MBB6174033.1 phosphatidylglycerophosphate synthase [Nocardiopsis mwathae]